MVLESSKGNFPRLLTFFLAGFLMIQVALAQQPSSTGPGSGLSSSKQDAAPAPAPPKPDTPNGTQAVAAGAKAVGSPGQPPQLALGQQALVDAEGRPLYETIEEDWSSLQVGVSKLEPIPPTIGEVADNEKFTRALVQVQWRPGDPIDLWIVLPKGVKKPPVVLYVYNFLEDPERFHNDGWCERVTRGGAAAVGFLSALSSDRFRNRPLKQWFVSELQESLGSTVHDVKFILDYLDSRGDVDMSRVGIFGEGSGGAIAILAAAADPRIKAVDTLDPWGDWPDFLTQSPVVQVDPNKEDFGTPEFLKKVAPLDPVKWLPKLTVPIRVQQVLRNLAVPLECKEAIKAALPKQAELFRFEGVDELARRESGGGLFEWIKEELRTPAKPEAASDSKKSSPGGEDSALRSAAHP